MDVRGSWSAPVREVSLVVDQEALSQLETLEEKRRLLEAKAAATNDDSLYRQIQTLDEQIAEAKATAEQSRLVFRFRGIGRREFNDLLEDAPPTDPEMEFDPDKFVGPLLKACSMDGLTDDDVEWMLDHYTDAQITKLFMAAWSANRAVKDIPFTGPDTGGVSGSEPNSTTAPSEGSPILSF